MNPIWGKPNELRTFFRYHTFTHYMRLLHSRNSIKTTNLWEIRRDLLALETNPWQIVPTR